MEAITYNISHKAFDAFETALERAGNDILAKVQQHFGNSYTITATEYSPAGDDWTHTIKIRNGNKTGAEITLKWNRTTPDLLKAEVDESSVLGSWITYGSVVPLTLTGAIMGYAHIEPLAFLPGQKIATGLGGVIGFFVGFLLVAIIKPMAMGKETKVNAKLVHQVIKIIKP